MLTVSGLTRIFANRFDSIAGGVRDAAFHLPAGAFFTLLGPSGCGKTTTLRCLAGLERPDAGRIELDGRVMFDSTQRVLVPVHERGIGMVFQSYAIWPHMTVFENVAFPLRVARRRVAPNEVAAKVERALATVGLGGYGPRPATRLSGGQQQRVALARAIVHEPKLLLLDEPLSNLDAALREEMRGELRRLQQEIGVTTVYVTHDQAEALAMSDRIAVMEGGRIVQLDTPRTIYATPASEFVARFIGAANILTGTAEAAVGAGAVGAVRLSGHQRILAHFPAAVASGAAVNVAVRPESIAMSAADMNGETDVNVVPAVLRSVNFLGATLLCGAQAGGMTIRASIPGGAAPQIGAAVTLHFAARHSVALAD
jgi:iron(III) transport system ATP-binding protein